MRENIIEIICTNSSVQQFFQAPPAVPPTTQSQESPCSNGALINITLNSENGQHLKTTKSEDFSSENQIEGIFNRSQYKKLIQNINEANEERNEPNISFWKFFIELERSNSTNKKHVFRNFCFKQHICQQLISDIQQKHQRGENHGSLSIHDLYLNENYELKARGFKIRDKDAISYVNQVKLYRIKAPEIISLFEDHKVQSTKLGDAIDFDKLDSFHLGLIIFEIFYQTHPFDIKTQFCKRIKMIRQDNFRFLWDQMTKYTNQLIIDGVELSEILKIQSLIEQLITFDIKQRIQIQDINPDSFE